MAVVTRDGEVIPLADGLGHFLRGGLGVIDRADHAIVRAVRVFVHLDFERRENVVGVAGLSELRP